MQHFLYQSFLNLYLTREAFSITKSIVFSWKKKLKDANHNPSALLPLSRAPIRKRQKE